MIKSASKEKAVKGGDNMTEDVNLTAELTAVLEEIVEEKTEEKKAGKEPIFELLNESEFMLAKRHYRLVSDYREGFDAEKLAERYSEVLARYDYIVGDWGYEQLRLKGFFSETNKRVLPEQRIDTLQDYLYEYCNFGCAYFVIERIGGKKEKGQVKKTKRRNHTTTKPATVSTNKPKNQAHISEKVAVVSEQKTKLKFKTRDTSSQKKTEVVKATQSNQTKKSFTIRQRNDGD